MPVTGVVFAPASVRRITGFRRLGRLQRVEIFDDVADVLIAEGILEGRHNAAASSQNSRANLSISSGCSAGEGRTLKNPVEQRSLFPRHEFFPVVAAAAVHLKQLLATSDFLGLSPTSEMRTAGQRNGNEYRERQNQKPSRLRR